MPKFIIERNIPGAGKFSADELQAISQKSVAVLRNLAPGVQWVQSFVVDEKIYCIYNADNADLILEHARCGGFPADRVSEVRAVIDPITAETHAPVAT